MSTYCRITGKSRGLPKPNYFPLLPPISPADAKRFCRITGKAYGLPAHHYIPVLVGRKKTKSDPKHVVINGYRYVFPVINESSELSDLLKTKSTDDRRHVYAVDKRRCSLVFPTNLEHAVRDGDIKDVMMSEVNDTLLLKLRKGTTVELEIKEIEVNGMSLMEGEGFRNRPKKKKNIKDDWRRKIFEEKEKESDAELEQEELKSKRITFSAGQGKKVECVESVPTIMNAKSINISKIKNIIQPTIENLILGGNTTNDNLKLQTNVLPTPISIEPNIIDLNSAFPGVVHQTFLDDNTLTSLPMVPVISPIKPLIDEFKQLPGIMLDHEACVTEEILIEDNINKFFTVNEINLLTENIKIGSLEFIPTSHGTTTKVLKLKIENTEKYVPGQFVKTDDGETFVPGEIIKTPNGKLFVHGIMVQTSDGPKFLPGQIIEKSGKSMFIAGQNIITREGESFVPGQTIIVEDEKKFIPGQTVITSEGLGFVAGQTINKGDESHFIPGQTIMSINGPQFIPGQFLNNANMEFMPGQSILKNDGEWEFIPGVCVGSSFVPGLTVVEEDKKEFVPGRLLQNNNEISFVPGITTLDNNSNTKFVLGLSIQTERGVKFVSGSILTDDFGNKQFILGHVSNSKNGMTIFNEAKSLQEAICSDDVQSGILTNDSFYPKGEKSDEVFGHMVQTAYGVEFYPGGNQLGLPAGKIVPGKLIRNNGIRFVPGAIVDDKFIPGQIVVTDRGEQFVPGQVIETQTGPKFVPGQVVETETGSKFVPGQTIETKDGVKFVPGQIVETKAGPTFIPGQIIFTEEEGSRFVPGQVVDTVEGPRFVPGRVIETGDHVTFVPGQVVETTEGLRFIAPDLQDADDGDCEFSVQGFEVSPEELKVIQPSFPQTSYYTQNGVMALDSRMLEQLSLAGMSIGRQVPVELPVVDVSILPSMEVAYDVAEKLELNNDNTIKLAHIINRLCKLDFKKAYYGSPLVQNLIQKLPPIKTNEKVAKIIENVLKTTKTSPITALNEMYAVIFDDTFVTDLKSPNKVNILKGIMNSFELEPKYIAEAFSEILNDLEDSKLRSAFEHIAEENIELLKEVKLKINMEKVNTEKEAIEALQWAIVNVVNKNSDITVNRMLKDNKSEEFNHLLSDAVGLAKALGLKEVVSVLMDVLDDRRSADILASDKITIEILRRLTVMRKLAEKRPEFSETLNGMSANPIEARLDPKLRELVRESGVLLLTPETKVETSFDIPHELFSSGNSLAMEDFMIKSRKMGILLIIKNGLQAVVPREAARLVLTGQVPYTVLDEKGIYRFEPMNVLDALNIRPYICGRYSMYNCAVQKVLTEDEGTITRGSSISLDDKQLAVEEGGGEEYEVLRDYETEPVDGADEEDDLILESGDRVVVLKQSKDDPSMDAEVKRNLLLDNAAAKHKMSVRPNKVHPTKHKSLDMDGSLVQSLDEPTKMGYVPNSILKKIAAPVRATAVVPADGQTLSKKDAKFNRDVVLGELVETEEEFGQDIQEVVERYFNPLESNDAPRIVRDNKDLIFNNLKQISQFHNTVLIAGLKYAASEPKTMGKTFLRLERDFDKHVNYCETEPDAQEFLERNYEVRDYFEDERLKFADDKALSEHLKLPIQRINDYQLLLKELVKYSLLIGEDTTDLERALELMLSIPHRFTDTKFLSNIEGFHGSVHKLGRLLKHGWYYVQDAEDPKGHQRYCFLFKSRILVCKVRRITEDRSVFVLKDIIRLPEVTVKAAPDNKRCWTLHHRQGEVGNYPFTFRANEDVSRDQWVTEIEEHKNDLREKEDLQEQFWEREYVSIIETIKSSISDTSKSSIPVTNIEHNSDDLKVQKQQDEDLFEPLKGLELDISSEIEEGLDPIERRVAPKPLKHVEEPKRPPLTLPPKEPIFECTSPPEPKNKPEPEIIQVEEPPVVEMPVPKEVKVEEIKEVPIILPEPVPVEIVPPPPERSPSPCEEEIEAEPLKYVEGVSKPYFHVKIKGTNHGGIIEEYNEWWDTKGEFKSGRSMNNESSLAVGENAVFECDIEGATKVTWLKNNMPLPNSISHRTTLIEEKENNVYKLQINKVIMSDSGTYTVKAENNIGESTSTALLFVENLSADEKKARAKANAPIFAVKLADTQLLENTYARFMIEIKGNPLPKLRFFKGDKEITDEDKRIEILEVNKEKGLYELILPDVKPEDAGEYRVVASNKYSEESCSCQVTVTTEKDLWAGMQTEVPDGTPKFTWLKNGKPFNPEERFKVLFRDDEDSLALVFQNVKPEDAGLYTCIASTSHGKISCSAELSVQGVVKELNLPYGPRIITEVKEYETKIQGTAILEAKVIGDPIPDITWLKNNEEIKENERIKMMFEDEIAALVVKNVDVEDEGEYEIRAKNDIGSATDTINLFIKAAPRFRKNLTDYEGVTGKDITLTVEIEASPKPIVQWYKDSKTIKKSNRIKYVTDEVSGSYTLIIEDCKMEDVGLYSVVASNQFSQISDACQINLQMPPQFIGALAKEVETLEGDYVSLSVRVEGDPPPQVKWYFEDKQLIADKTHIKINESDDVHTLLISNLTRNDSGKYTCEISNEFGKNTSEGQLFVRCPPIFETPLTDMKAAEGDTNVEFTVKLNSYPKASVQWFREEDEITETTTEFTCIEDGDNFKLVIKEAKTKLSGTYKCRATNEIGTYESEATLTVMSQPTFKKELRDMEVTEGGMLKLQVTCFGSPVPDIKWYKDGKEVRSDAHIKISRDKKRVENYSLTVNLVKVEDGGEYEVRATNEMGTAVTKSIVNVLAKHSTDCNDEETELAKDSNEDIKNDITKKEKVLLPLNINHLENTKERLLETHCETDRKLGMASIKNLDGDQSIKTEENLVIMSSQSGEFSCVEISWEESSTKSNNYYGVVEEPKDERIIPIKIDRGISIHTASDEEEEPFWVVESVKKREEVRNEIKKMKENRLPQISQPDKYCEDDDDSLNELLKRVQKQRNNLENIIEQKNKNNNEFEEKQSEKSSYSTYTFNEKPTLKARSISMLSSLEEEIKGEETSDNSLNEPNSNTYIKEQKESSSIAENTSVEVLTYTTDDLNTPKQDSMMCNLSIITKTNKSFIEVEQVDGKYSKSEESIFNNINTASISNLSSIEELNLPKKDTNEYLERPKRGSTSISSSIDEYDSSSMPTKINENSKKPRKGSLSRLSSTEDTKQDSITQEYTASTNKPDESIPQIAKNKTDKSNDEKAKNDLSEKSKRSSMSTFSSVDEDDNSSTPTKINENFEKPRKSSLSRLSSTEDTKQDSVQKKYTASTTKLDEPNDEITKNELSEKPKRDSISRFSSIDDDDNSSTQIKINENFEKPRKSSLSKLSSAEDTKQDSTSKKYTASNTKSEESNDEIAKNELAERPKSGSMSKLSSIDEHDNSVTPTKINENFEKPRKGSLSRLSSTEDTKQDSTSKKYTASTAKPDESYDEKAKNELSERPKRGSMSRFSSIDEHDNSVPATKINENSEKPRKGSLSRLSSTEDTKQDSTSKKYTASTAKPDESYDEKAKNELSERPKRGSMSRFSSIDEHDNSVPATKINENSEKPRKGSLSRLSSTEDTKLDSIPKKYTASSTKPDKSNDEIAKNEELERPKRSSMSRFSSIEEHNESSKLTKINEDTEKPRKSSLSKISSTEDSKQDSNTKQLSKAINIDDLRESNTLQMLNEDKAESRRKSLIKQSSIISDSLNATCKDFPNSNLNEQKDLSTNVNCKPIDITSKDIIEDDLLKPSSKTTKDHQTTPSKERFDCKKDEKNNTQSNIKDKENEMQPSRIIMEKGNEKMIESISIDEKCGDISTSGTKKIGVPPEILSGLDDVDTYESLTQVFNVKARGTPKPKVQWFKDGNELSNTRNIKIQDSDDEELFKLTIMDLRVADSGSYCCKLINEVGEDMKSAKLNVQDIELLRGPKIKKPLSDLEVKKGQKVTWSMTLVADPVPEVEWTCDGKVVNADFTIDSSEKANGLKECTFTMTIPTSELSDTGVYRVKATNKFDSAECSARLDIVMKPEIEGFHDVTVIPSMEAVFEAIIKAVPKPKIVWTVNGNDLSQREHVNLTSEELEKDITKFKIVIGNVNPEEEGEYVVKAWNKVGETTAIANLKLHTEVPSFVKLLEDKTIEEYEEVQLSVRVNGIPKPKVTWFKNGEVVIPDLRISVHTNEEGQIKSTLTIDHFSSLDIANFSVKAVNMMGEAETSSSLTMAEIMPSFVKPFERITEAVEGSPIELQTQLIGSPRPHVAWYKDGEELKNEEGESADDKPHHITLETKPNGTVMMKIDKVEQGDCGAYKVIATNNFGTSATNTALVVNELPKTPIIINHPKNINISEGEILKIEAQYIAYPEALVKWYKDGHVLHPCPQLDFVMGPNGNIALVIEKATLDDAGDYEVVISNEMGKVTGQIEVKVRPAPTAPAFITPLRDSKVVEGFPAKLQFKLSGFPLPEIAWTLNEKPIIVDGEKIKMVHEPDGTHYLLIEKAGPEHAGKLAVIASNENGKITSEAELSVTPKVSSDSSETKPLFLNGLKDTTVEESNTLSLLAPFLGNPIPDVKWEKDGKILQPCNKIHFTCDGYKVGLEVQDTNTGDAGQYTCTLTNNLGSAASTCHVGVRKLYQAPVFTQRFSHNQQLLSRDAKFHARVTGVPSPNILWHKNGHQLSNGDKYQIRRDGEVCSLTIRDVKNDDAGLYSCIATNRDGTATCEAQLSIAPRIVDESRKQEAPSFLKKIGDCEVFDGMTAKFTACATGWPEPEYEWFLDTYRLYETERIRMEKEGSGLLRMKILHADPLIDSGRYKLRIFNPHGEAYCEASIIFDNGLDSRSKRPVGELYKDYDRYRATGAPLPLPDPPTIIRMTDKRLTIAWKPSLPITPRTPVTYLVEMEEQPKGEWSTVRAGIRGCACDIHNLIPFRDYKFRVRVENNFGISDPSPFVLTYREKLEPEPPKFTPYLPPGTNFRPESSSYFPKDFDIERPPHDNYAQAPRFLHQEHDTQYGVKGHNVNLYWFVYGYPKPKVQYYFDNQLVEMGGRYDSSYTRNGQATLFINKMLDRDIGTYEAVATNEHGTARQRVRLQIAEYPKFIKRPEETYAILRKNCKLEARVIGVPYPEIKWFKDWKPLVDSARIQIEKVEPDVCILRIEDIIMKDEGLYSISARNLAGSISTSVAIHVEDRESDYSSNGKTDIKWKKKELSELYDIGDELGRGTQGVVYHAVERSTGRNYAAKIMHAKEDHLTKLMDNELKIMTDLSNRRIIRIHDALQTSRTYTLITELAGGGELLDNITKNSFHTEYDIASYIIQLLKALKYMHDFDIAHLGLTPGDLLISHPGSDKLKLCDFGLSRKINRRKLEPVDYGMPEFISPEIAKGEGVDLSSDMWSVGVITHLLLTGHSLFRCVNDADTLDRVKIGSYTLSTKISDLAKDFISKLLVFNAHDRMDVITALQHPWLQFGEDIPAETSRINTNSLRNYYNNFKDWYSNSSCRNWYRRRPLSSAYTHPSKMIYPPGFMCTPSPTPEPEPKKPMKHVPSWKDKLPAKEPIDTEIGIIKSESHYQYGPDTYLLQLRDTNFPVRLREYMKVAGKSLTHRDGSDSHLDWEAPVIRERRRFTDIMDEEIEDEQKARISKYGADVYTLRRLKQEIGSRPTAHVEAEAILESRIDGQPPFFREKPQKLPIEPDKPADLMCLAVGVPKPLIQWFKNDIVLTESHRIKILEDNDGRSILRLDPATELDLGIYKVVARNKFGQTTTRARLVLAREPGPMDNPIVKEFSDTEILLQWDHPKLDGNAPILCYQLEVRENESDWELVAKNIDHEFWLMQNLRPYTNYEFRLRAMNRIGWGPTGPASPIVRTHFPDAKKLDVPPAMLNLQIITENGREIIGDEPRNNLDYSLEYKPTDWIEQPPIEKYRFISEIARGRFSVILKGINTSNDSIIVAKLLEITPDTEGKVTQEFNVLKTLKHERIAYLIEAFKLENAPVAVFIQEKLQGADILTYLSTKEQYSEQTVATIVAQVLDGLQYLHWRGYAHLDLQPDNIVMASVRTIQVKLIDFGCARKVSKLGAVVMANSVLDFTAPEILCDEPAYPYSDIWSLGVIAYTLLSGMSPFRGVNDIETRQNITFVRYRFEYLYKDLSQEATRFLMLLFKRTPTKRPSAEECHEHRWLLPTEYMIKKREKTMFNSFKLQHFAKEYHENRTKVATSSQKLLSALGTRQIGLGRSNSIVDELLIFK